MARAQAPVLLRTASTRIFGPKTSPIISQALAPDDFSLILFPDTQNEAQYYPQVLASETQWVANNRAALNIQAVLGLGDIVNDGASTAQQQNADAAIRTLDTAGVPYLLAIGNHDYDAAKPSTRTAMGFNNWFGPSRYAKYSYYQGSYPPGSNENFYGVLTINGQQYLFLILEYVPRDAALNWAASILQANQDKEVIVVTHSYMFKDNTRVDQCDTKDLNSDNYGDKTWSKLISQYPNIIMVVSGHVTTGNAARRADLGVNGNLVNQMFSNYQTLANGGNGWLRILTFHPSQNSIDVSTYSPYLNSNKTDPANQFTLDYHNPHLSAGGQGTISGLVRDSGKCTAIPGARVTAGGTSALTDSNGHYSLTLPASQAYPVTTSVDDWNTSTRSATVNEGYDSDLNFFLEAKNSCILSTTNRTVTICEPGNNENVGSPVHVVAGTTDSSPVTSLQIYIDGVVKYTVNAASLNTNLAIAPGTHRLTVQARDAAGIFKQTINITVSDQPALRPSSITFSSTTVGSSSAPQPASLTAGSAALTVMSISTAGDFTQTNNCGTSLAAGASCQISVTFAPTANGTRSGTLTVSDSDASSPQIATLSGAGSTPSQVTLSPNSLSFGSQNVNTTSAPQAITLTNNNTSDIDINGITTSGDFAQTNNCGTAVAAGGSCVINVTFKPTASGTRTGTLTVGDSDPGSPQSASLSGTGAATQTCQVSTVNRTVTICTPGDNATVTSPVHVVAKTTDTSPVTTLQIYVDGVAVYTVHTPTLDTNINLAAGSHRLTVQAKDAAGTFKQTVTVTAK